MVVPIPEMVAPVPLKASNTTETSEMCLLRYYVRKAHSLFSCAVRSNLRIVRMIQNIRLRQELLKMDTQVGAT